MKVATVTFGEFRDEYAGQGDYEYLIPDHLDFEKDGSASMIEEGTLVVVDSPHGGYKFATVKEVKDRIDSKWDGEFKPLVDVVDDSRYKSYLDRLGRAAQIKRELMRRAEERNEMKAFEELARGDIAMGALVEELKRLDA